MKRISWQTIILILAVPLLVWAAGTVTDYVTLTPAAAPGAADEGTLYYDSDTDLFYAHDDANWYALGPECIQYKPIAVSPHDIEGATYYDSDTDRLYVYTGAAVYQPLNAQTLDEVYTSNPAVTIDATGAIALTSTLVDATDMLTITRSGAAGTGQLLQLTDSQTGAHASVIIDHTAGNASSGGVHIRDNAADATALAYLLKLESVDDAQVVTDALVIAATTAAGITDAIDVSDAEITNAINVGANTIAGTTCVINFDLLDMDAAGDFVLSETGGSSADPDFESDGYSLIGVTSGGALGDATHRTNFSHDGVITFSGNARPVGEKWIWPGDIDLEIVDGDYTAPTENEARGDMHWRTYEFTEGTDYITYVFPVPSSMDVSAALNIKILWTDEDAGGNTATWVVTYCKITPDNNEDACDPTTALDTPIAADATDAQYEVALSAAGVINGATFTDGDIVIFKIGLTSMADGAEGDLIAFRIYWSMENL